MMKGLEYSDAMKRRREHWIHDDFDWYVSPHQWTSVLTDSGTAAVGDVTNGILVLTPSDGSVADNDQTIVKSTNAVYLFADQKPMLFDVLLQFTENATNKANIAAGWMSGIAADQAQLDDGAGPVTSFSGAFIYKVDGGTVWKCISSVGSTQNISTSTTTAGGSAYQRLKIEVRNVSTTVVEISFFCDGQQLLDATTGKPIKHQLTFTGAAQMNAFFAAKNGDGTNQLLNVDVVDIGQLR